MILLDTHVLIWFLQADSSLGRQARHRIEQEQRDDGIQVSAITPWEIAMLIAKKRLSLGRSTSVWMDKALGTYGVGLAPLDPAVAIEAGELVGLHGDAADRIIIATARHHDWPLVTSDRTILTYAAAGHLRAIDARI